MIALPSLDGCISGDKYSAPGTCAKAGKIDDRDRGIVQRDKIVGLELLQGEIHTLATYAEQVRKVGLRSLERQLPAVRSIAAV